MRLMVLAIAAAAFLAGGCQRDGHKNWAFIAGRTMNAYEQRPTYWGQPMTLRGVPNMVRVTDDLYRGDEPSRDGMIELKRIGVKSIINVRSWSMFHSTEGRTEGLGLKYFHIPMVAWQPNDEHTVQFLRIMADPSNRPVFIHCYTGGDRVGLFVAIYRVAFCGWTKDEAKAEMLYGGYDFHSILERYLVPYFDDLDIDRMKVLAGVNASTITTADIEGAMPQPFARGPRPPPSKDSGDSTDKAANKPPLGSSWFRDQMNR